MTLADRVQERFHLAREAYPQGELEFMCEAVEEVRPQLICEWGTGSGASGRIFREATDVLGIECLLCTTDLPDLLAPLEEQHPRERTGMYLTTDPLMWVQRGDGVTESLKLYASILELPTRTLWFLDGDHSYYAVYREIALIDRMVPDAVMLLHDTLSGPGEAARKWVQDQGRHRFVEISGRTGIGRLDPL